MAFGLCKMLGFRLAPRFRDLNDQRFWPADLPDGGAPAGGYGPLDAVACNKVNCDRSTVVTVRAPTSPAMPRALSTIPYRPGRGAFPSGRTAVSARTSRLRRGTGTAGPG
nr:transposase [Streptomyces sp. BK239]